MRKVALSNLRRRWHARVSKSPRAFSLLLSIMLGHLSGSASRRVDRGVRSSRSLLLRVNDVVVQPAWFACITNRMMDV